MCYEKIMSQVELSPITDFLYETKVGFSFIVGEVTPLTLQSKTEGWWHFPGFDVPVTDPPPAI